MVKKTSKNHYGAVTMGTSAETGESSVYVETLASNDGADVKSSGRLF